MFNDCVSELLEIQWCTVQDLYLKIVSAVCSFI